jgi:hypothetical protein
VQSHALERRTIASGPNKLAQVKLMRTNDTVHDYSDVAQRSLPASPRRLRLTHECSITRDHFPVLLASFEDRFTYDAEHRPKPRRFRTERFRTLSRSEPGPTDKPVSEPVYEIVFAKPGCRWNADTPDSMSRARSGGRFNTPGRTTVASPTSTDQEGWAFETPYPRPALTEAPRAPRARPRTPPRPPAPQPACGA